MRLLLIDFGASYIKTTTYDTTTKEIGEVKNINSPFQSALTITRLELTNLINKITSEYNVDGIVVCTIIGGGWINDIYHSWKSTNDQPKHSCLLSGLFINETTYHVHNHHGGDINKLKILGYINNIPVYSSLGDTNCVMESLTLNNKECIINIGTGSQVIKTNIIHKYIPAGRALLVYKAFFDSINVDFFTYLNNVTVDDVYQSTLQVDMNIFKQSAGYVAGGSISLINENMFTINNLAGSILKSIVLQYKPYIQDINTVQLTGGISKKLPILVELFKYYYKDKIFNILQEESTHKGMINYINKHLL